MTRKQPITTGRRPSEQWTLGDQVYERLVEMIATGVFPENSRLPSETALAERLGVSRPVLRQALGRLRENRIINSRRGSGSFVRRRTDSSILHFAPVDSIADIRRCFEFRLAVEGEAARYAAERWTDASIGSIREALSYLDECIRTGELGTDADEAFHVAICQATDNRFFAAARVSMQSHIIFGMTLARRLSLTKPIDRLALVQAEHVAICDAIERRDGATAEAAMRAHIENAQARVFEGYEPDLVDATLTRESDHR